MLLDLYQADGLTARRVSTGSGGEYAGPCPGCGGVDRFRLFPERDRWFCRGCSPRGGDAIQYLRAFRGLSYPEACQVLGQEPASRPRTAAKPPERWEPKPSTPPPALWQEKAAALVGWAEGNLWGEAGAEARAYLEGRGLTAATIRAARLGLVLEDLWRDREAWGLEPAHHEDGPRKGKPKRLWIPAGVVIPTFTTAGQLARVKVRRWEGDLRYYALPGGEARPLVAGQGPAVVVVESELDALLVAQEAGDLVQAMALGSAQARPTADAWEVLQAAPAVLVALDSDQAGAKEAWTWWRGNVPQAHRWPVPGHKDPTEAHQAGFDLALWVEAGLEAGQPQERPRKMPQERRSPAGPTPHPSRLPLAAQCLFAAALDRFTAQGLPLAEAERLALAEVPSWV